MKFSSLAALKVVILTTFSAASDENFVKMTFFASAHVQHLSRYPFNQSVINNAMPYALANLATNLCNLSQMGWI